MDVLIILSVAAVSVILALAGARLMLSGFLYVMEQRGPARRRRLQADLATAAVPLDRSLAG